MNEESRPEAALKSLGSDYNEVNTGRRPLPPFRAEDWQDLSGPEPDYFVPRAKQLCANAEFRHEDHHRQWNHPACGLCEIRPEFEYRGILMPSAAWALVEEHEDRLWAESVASGQDLPSLHEYRWQDPEGVGHTAAGALELLILEGWRDFETPPDCAQDLPLGGYEVALAWARSNALLVEISRRPFFDDPWERSRRRMVRYLLVHGKPPAEHLAVAPAPRPKSLDEFLAEPDEEPTYRIAELLPTGARAIVAAQYKAGKTTLVGNLVRAVVDGEQFLGRLAVRQGTVAIDVELDERMLRRWMRDQGIVNTEAVTILSLRGRASSFNILDPATRADWAKLLAGCDVVILDCLRPILDALGLSEDKDAGRFLVAFDELLREAGASESLTVHHMGHNGERSRGDSRILDWPDATWNLVRENPKDPHSPRYLSALGRDVDFRESRLEYDAPSRRLALTGGSRQETKDEVALAEIIDWLASNAGASQTDIEEAVPGRAQEVRKAIAVGIDRGRITRTKVSRAYRHSLTPSHTSDHVPDEGRVSPVNASRVYDADADGIAAAGQRGRNPNGTRTDRDGAIELIADELGGKEIA